MTMTGKTSLSLQEKIYEQVRNTSDLSTLNLPKTEEFLNCNGQRIHVRTYWPKDGNGNICVPKAVILYIHGYGGHVNRLPYEALGSHYTSNEIAFITFDQFGHGYSTGVKAFVPKPAELVRLVLRIVDLIYHDIDADAANDHLIHKPTNPMPSTTPLFIMGQSMGGAVALLTGLELYPLKNINFQGCILLCPALKVTTAPSAIKRFALDYIMVPLVSQATMAPNMALSKDLHHSWLNDDYIKYVETDRNPANPQGLGYNGEMRYGSASHMLRLCEKSTKRFPLVHFPFLIFHDPEDHLTSFQGSLALFEQAKTPDNHKKLVVMHNSAHDLTINRLEEIAEQSLQWIQDRLNLK